MTKTEFMDSFKTWLVMSANQDIYNQLKDYLSYCDLDDDEYRDTLDYIANNITGEFVWSDC